MKTSRSLSLQEVGPLVLTQFINASFPFLLPFYIITNEDLKMRVSPSYLGKSPSPFVIRG